MKHVFKRFFAKKDTQPTEYPSLSDFFRRAPLDKKKQIFRKVAEEANADQLQTYKKARLKVG